MGHMLKDEVADKMRELILPMKGNRILEIGTGWGESALFFSELRPDWITYTIDAFGLYGDGRIYSKWDHDQVKKIADALQGKVIQIISDSKKVLWELEIDVLYIDGDHTFEGCLSDFNSFHKFVKNGGYIIFDDYTQTNNPNNGVKKVTEKVLELHPEFEVVYTGYYCLVLKKSEI